MSLSFWGKKIVPLFLCGIRGRACDFQLMKFSQLSEKSKWTNKKVYSHISFCFWKPLEYLMAFHLHVRLTESALHIGELLFQPPFFLLKDTERKQERLCRSNAAAQANFLSSSHQSHQFLFIFVQNVFLKKKSGF